MATISIVLPVMNEAGNIEAISKAIDKQFSSLQHDYELIFVCDPSSDGTENEITHLAL